MLTLRLTPGAPPALPNTVRGRYPGAAPAVDTQPPPLAAGSVTAPADAAWQAIVQQLLATSSARRRTRRDPEPSTPGRGRLGMHINRAP
jgi:hypothetical protein